MINAWVGGLFEGEGCISRLGKYDQVRIDIALHKRDLDVLNRLNAAYSGVGKLYGPYKNNMVHWIICGREKIVSFLIDVWPWIGRRRKAKAIELFPRMEYYRG